MTKKRKKPKKRNMTLHSPRRDPYNLKDWRPTDFTPPKSSKSRKYKPPKFTPPKFTKVPTEEFVPKNRRKTTLRKKNPSATDVMRDMRTSKHFSGPKRRRKKKK
jgi:hypothetical protein